MSKTTKAIMDIKTDLDRISGMDGFVGDYIVNLQTDIHNCIEWLLEFLKDTDDENSDNIITLRIVQMNSLMI